MTVNLNTVITTQLHRLGNDITYRSTGERQGINNSPNNIRALWIYDTGFSCLNHVNTSNINEPTYIMHNGYGWEDAYARMGELIERKGLDTAGVRWAPISGIIQRLANEVSLTGNVIEILNKPLVCSNIEELYIDPIVFASKTLQELHNQFRVILDCYMQGKQYVIPQSTVSALLWQYLGEGCLTTKFPRLREIRFISNLENMIRTRNEVQFKPGLNNHMTWADRMGLNNETLADKALIFSQWERPRDVSEDFTTRPGIYAFDADVLEKVRQKEKVRARMTASAEEPKKLDRLDMITSLDGLVAEYFEGKQTDPVNFTRRFIELIQESDLNERLKIGIVVNATSGIGENRITNGLVGLSRETKDIIQGYIEDYLTKYASKIGKLKNLKYLSFDEDVIRAYKCLKGEDTQKANAEMLNVYAKTLSNEYKMVTMGDFVQTIADLYSNCFVNLYMTKRSIQAKRNITQLIKDNSSDVVNSSIISFLFSEDIRRWTVLLGEDIVKIAGERYPLNANVIKVKRFDLNFLKSVGTVAYLDRGGAIRPAGQFSDWSGKIDREDKAMRKIREYFGELFKSEGNLDKLLKEPIGKAGAKVIGLSITGAEALKDTTRTFERLSNLIG